MSANKTSWREVAIGIAIVAVATSLARSCQNEPDNTACQQARAEYWDAQMETGHPDETEEEERLRRFRFSKALEAKNRECGYNSG